MPHPLLEYAAEVIRCHLEKRPAPEPAHDAASAPSRGCFVSLKKAGRLRGCIGTLEPVCRTLAEEIAGNALAAATRDSRFEPVRPEELAQITFSLDLLSPMEPVASQAQLDPAHYGVVVKSGNRRGVLLPDLPGVETVEKQVAICREKAGIAPDEPVELERFTVERIT